MSEIMDNLINKLETLDLDKIEAIVYLELLKYPELTALKLSRSTNIKRTKIYRILEKLVAKGVVLERIDEVGTKFIACKPEDLELLILKKENHLKNLKSGFKEFIKQLEIISNQSIEESKVLYYRGLDGLKQISWNSLKANKELLTMEISDLNAFVDDEFAEELRFEIVRRGIKVRTITNQTHIRPWTKVKYAASPKHWEVRHIDEKDLDIKFEVLIYNNVYCLYSYEDGEIFCVEIYNDRLVRMQRQIFEFIWKQGNRFKIRNEFGEGKLI